MNISRRLLVFIMSRPLSLPTSVGLHPDPALSLQELTQLRDLPENAEEKTPEKHLPSERLSPNGVPMVSPGLHV